MIPHLKHRISGQTRNSYFPIACMFYFSNTSLHSNHETQFRTHINILVLHTDKTVPNPTLIYYILLLTRTDLLLSQSAVAVATVVKAVGLTVLSFCKELFP
jgi:hypothetical protein